MLSKLNNYFMAFPDVFKPADESEVLEKLRSSSFGLPLSVTIHITSNVEAETNARIAGDGNSVVYEKVGESTNPKRLVPDGSKVWASLEVIRAEALRALGQISKISPGGIMGGASTQKEFPPKHDGKDEIFKATVDPLEAQLPKEGEKGLTIVHCEAIKSSVDVIRAVTARVNAVKPPWICKPGEVFAVEFIHKGKALRIQAKIPAGAKSHEFLLGVKEKNGAASWLLASTALHELGLVKMTNDGDDDYGDEMTELSPRGLAGKELGQLCFLKVNPPLSLEILSSLIFAIGENRRTTNYESGKVLIASLKRALRLAKRGDRGTFDGNETKIECANISVPTETVGAFLVQMGRANGMEIAEIIFGSSGACVRAHLSCNPKDETLITRFTVKFERL